MRSNRRLVLATASVAVVVALGVTLGRGARRPLHEVSHLLDDPEAEALQGERFWLPYSPTFTGCRGLIEITLTRTDLLVGAEVVVMIRGGAIVGPGDADDERDPLIPSLLARLQRELARLAKVETRLRGKLERGFVLRADRQTPYRLIARVLYTAASANLRGEVLTLAQPTFTRLPRRRCLPLEVLAGTSWCELECPALRRRARRAKQVEAEGVLKFLRPGGHAELREIDRDHPAPPLTVTVATDGLRMRAGGEDARTRVIRCSSALNDGRCTWRADAAGWTDGRDYAALSRQISAAEAEHAVLLTADRDLPWQSVVLALAALRGRVGAAVYLGPSAR